ncbi:MAG TPA: branched-chain amino acid ABC transporter permease [Methanothrix sp.]|nr:branched-chain amino acid ABC transporter permease [Methanothrix sp.]
MDYLPHLFIITGISVILALSLNLIMGYMGQSALGHAAFYAIGAYSSSLLALNAGVSPWIGLLVGATFAAISGVVIGYLTFHLKEDYFALATFGFGLIVYSIINNWIGVTRGPMGLPGIPQFITFSDSKDYFLFYCVLILLFVLITIFITRKIVYSPFGRVVQSIRDDELAAEALGKDTRRVKITIFAIGAFFAGVAGSLYAHYITFIDPSSFDIMESIIIVLMVILGGMGTIEGSVLGAAVLILFPEMLRFIGIPGADAASLRQMIYGLLLVILIMKRPQGLVGKYKLW